MTTGRPAKARRRGRRRPRSGHAAETERYGSCMVSSRDPASYADGTPWDAADRHLAAADPVLRTLIRRMGPVSLFEAESDLFGSLILAIVSQQFSTRAARAMYDRILGQFGGQVPSAAALLAADPDELRV